MLFLWHAHHLTTNILLHSRCSRWWCSKWWCSKFRYFPVIMKVYGYFLWLICSNRRTIWRFFFSSFIDHTFYFFSSENGTKKRRCRQQRPKRIKECMISLKFVHSLYFVELKKSSMFFYLSLHKKISEIKGHFFINETHVISTWN